MHIRNRARKLIDPVDTGHLTYGEAHAAALAISTQNALRAEDPELIEAGAKAIGEVVAMPSNALRVNAPKLNEPETLPAQSARTTFGSSTLHKRKLFSKPSMP